MGVERREGSGSLDRRSGDERRQGQRGGKEPQSTEGGNKRRWKRKGGKELTTKALKDLTGNDIQKNIIFKKSYCVNDFENDYNSFKGNAYGLANTLKQTAVLKPRMRNKKVKNLYYAGQLTVPGPGVPPSIISGQIAAIEIDKYLNKLP